MGDKNKNENPELLEPKRRKTIPLFLTGIIAMTHLADMINDSHFVNRRMIVIFKWKHIDWLWIGGGFVRLISIWQGTDFCFDMTGNFSWWLSFLSFRQGGFTSCHNEKIIIFLVIENGQLRPQKCVPTFWGWFSVKDGHFWSENHSRKTNEIDHFDRESHFLWL